MRRRRLAQCGVASSLRPFPAWRLARRPGG